VRNGHRILDLHQEEAAKCCCVFVCVCVCVCACECVCQKKGGGGFGGSVSTNQEPPTDDRDRSEGPVMSATDDVTCDHILRARPITSPCGVSPPPDLPLRRILTTTAYDDEWHRAGPLETRGNARMVLGIPQTPHRDAEV